MLDVANSRTLGLQVNDDYHVNHYTQGHYFYKEGFLHWHKLYHSIEQTAF